MIEDEWLQNCDDAVLWHHQVTDLLAARTAGTLFTALDEADAQNLRPEKPIDLPFLFVIAVKSMSRHFGHTFLDTLLVHQPVSGFNYPDIDAEQWRDSNFVRSGLAKIFLETVQQNSVESADPFDVNYASLVMRIAVDWNFHWDDGPPVNAMSYIEEGRGRTGPSLWDMLEDGTAWT